MSRDLSRVGKGLLNAMVGRPLNWLWIHISPRRDCVGITVVDLTNDNRGSTSYFARVRSALEIIARYQPRRLDRIRRDLRYIIIVKQPGASYWSLLRACALSPEIVSSSDDEDIALTIVHEATHARIHARGIDFDIARRAHVERICVNAVISLAHVLPDGAERAARRSSELKASWSPEDIRADQIKTLEMNMSPGLARWLSARLPPLR